MEKKCREVDLEAECLNLFSSRGTLYTWHVCNIATCEAYHTDSIAVTCVLFYFSPLSHCVHKKITITWYQLLKGQYFWTCCWLWEKATHWWRFMFPLFSARTIVSYQNHVNTVRKLQFKIHYVLLSYLVAHPWFTSLPILQVCSLYFWAIRLPGNSPSSHTEGLFNVMLRYDCRSSVTEGNQRRERRGEKETEGKKTQRWSTMSWRGAKTKPDRRR